MPVEKLKEFLDKSNIKYVIVIHSGAYTAQEVAESAHISGKELAKTVVVKIDGKMAMAVLPASCKVELELLRKAAGGSSIELAGEEEFKGAFPDCEPGAMPPFGNLYGLDVFIDEILGGQDEIAFVAGSYTEVVRLSTKDFSRLVKPKVGRFALRP
jgi:Ala-tRNA(Pro) deacylase